MKAQWGSRAGGGGGQRHATTLLPWRMTRYPLYTSLRGRQGRFLRVEKMSTAPGFDLRIVQPVGSRYTAILCSVTAN